ncbi:hypothetical protein IYX23_14645 [Methylocystis sp. L43]|jgi:hypothetical protein|uniref:hypothetical protein n=1 Tax=unclassified Methylocystis TaxID=2625913 RepID=UPI0018C2D1B9|nr:MULTISPECIES: hypothetical protein [unclassified Methylocystis]MBG0798904.1 hypothetical protein [Methylocystis sp. L43]MBG0804027.1 hypothetical protein [Methylocystis sp. H15]
MSNVIKAAAATGALLIGLIAHSGASQAQRWDGWHGFGWGGGGFRGAVLPGVGWAGRWGGRGGWGRPVGWGQPWGWSYYRTDLPAYSPGYGAGVGSGGGWPSYANAGYGDCYQIRRVWTHWGWRRQWMNVCRGWGGDGGWGW